MKKLLSLLILSFVLLTGCSKKEEQSALDRVISRDMLIVGVTEESKPFGFVSQTRGEITGFDIDVAKYIAEDILGSDRKVKFVKISPSSRIEALTSDEVDIVVATMSITPQRQLLIDFSVPYYVAGQTALVREDSGIYKFADLKDKTTIVVLGTTAEKNIRKINPIAKIVGYKTYNDAFDAFLRGEGDAISSDDSLLSGFIMGKSGYRILNKKISKEYYAVGLKKHENDTSLKNSVNVVINRMQKDGTLKELKKKWALE